MRVAAAFILFFLMVSPFEAAVDRYDAGMTKCTDCHYRLPFPNTRLSFNEGIADICSLCHINHHGKVMKNSHPVNVFPSMPIPKDLPLDIKGKISCITCHTFHIGHNVKEGGKKFLLRRERGRTFCYSCHKKPLS